MAVNQEPSGRRDAESVGEDFTTFPEAESSPTYDALTKDGTDNPCATPLLPFRNGERVRAAHRVSRLMMQQFPYRRSLRARFIVVSPIYELGIAPRRRIRPDDGGAVPCRHHMAVTGHDDRRATSASFLKSPGDVQVLRAAASVDGADRRSQEFTIGGALI